ncbi:hypothetical protein HY993_03735 [Candidatus Micrarchaeota archaeon]|nr:hypothetical protein [Candidatus Micrarchaeota archaeon]
MKKPIKLTNALLFAALVAAVVLIAYFLSVGKSDSVNTALTGKSAVDANFESLSKKYAPLTISYQEPELNYSIRIPVGYESQSNPDNQTSLRVKANYPGASSEVFDVSAYEKTSFSARDFEEMRGEYQEAPGAFETTVNGRKTVLFSASNSSWFEGEQIFYRFALIDCPSYALLFNAVVPDELSSDLELYDYMLGSIKCPSE